jgi:hypothetical protein
MAVTQISKIQVRYGLQSDIGDLAAGEFAWAIDTQRLFIGNGSISEGAPYGGMTEILTGAVSLSQTLGEYIYKGYLGGYQVQTGADVDSTVVRLLQDKIDDFVNVRDFGAAGTGNTDDTAAIQRALDEIYNRLSNTVALRTRRVLRLNAGLYRINSDLRIPPYTTIVGEGKDSVKILLANNKLKLATSRGQDTTIYNADDEYPASISIKGLSIITTQDSDLFYIDGVTGINFEDVAFQGPRISPTDPGSSGSGVVIKSNFKVATDINFLRCTFSNLSRAVQIESSTGTDNINFDNCVFSRLYSGINTTNSGIVDAANIKVTNSVFTDIFTTAIYGDVGVSGLISMSNVYQNVGSNFEGDETSVTGWGPCMVFQADNNYSIADIFKRTLENSATYPRIQADDYKIASLSVDQAFRLGNSYIQPGQKITISSGNSGHTLLLNFKQGIISYSAARNNEIRTGTIKCTSSLQSATQVLTDEDYVETSDIGLTLSVDKPNEFLRLVWSSTDTGADLVLTFDTKTIH